MEIFGELRLYILRGWCVCCPTVLRCCVDWNRMLYRQKDRHCAMSVRCLVCRHYSNEYFAFLFQVIFMYRLSLGSGSGSLTVM